ncbi:MAG: hypothetical protein K0R55_3617 [Sporomusa sp.]|jgi:hypothetical protein|nr:hypothetical protein [Sporomusa sp.]
MLQLVKNICKQRDRVATIDTKLLKQTALSQMTIGLFFF